MENIKDIVKKTNLSHIAIIMDGNRRWAKNHHLPASFGHKKGVEALKKIVKACHKYEIKYLTLYAFSTENWKRSEDEVGFLMDLFIQTIENELQELFENNVKLKFIGNLDKLNDNLCHALYGAEEKTKNNTGVNLQIAINYGSRDEIVNAVKNIIDKKINSEDITEKLISDNLYTKNIPDPDLLIRTGGEKRISNYLLWQIAYSEIYVTKTLWPEFNEETLKKALIEFEGRHRRYGA